MYSPTFFVTIIPVIYFYEKGNQSKMVFGVFFYVPGNLQKLRNLKKYNILKMFFIELARFYFELAGLFRGLASFELVTAGSK